MLNFKLISDRSATTSRFYGLQAQFVEGSHLSMMNEPGLSQLARAIQAEPGRDTGRGREPSGRARGAGRGWWRAFAR